MDVTDHVDQVSSKKSSFSSEVSEVSLEGSPSLIDGDHRGHSGFSVVDDGNDGIGNIGTGLELSYVSTKCHSFQISMLYCLPLRSSGQTADSMKVRVLLSQRLLMERTTSLKLTEA